MLEISKEEILNILEGIESEGFDYFFINYTSPNENTNPELAALWNDYKNAHSKLNDFINDKAKELGLEDYV